MFGMVLDFPVVMKVAVSDWQGRVSPVFDVAAQLLVAEVKDDTIHERHTVPLTNNGLHERAKQVADLGVDVLICGAISWPLELALSNAGVEVFPQTCGEVDQVLAAFVTGRLSQNVFLMPGCCGRRRHCRNQHGHGRLPGKPAEQDI